MHPTRGPVPPSQFIPIAEESGLIIRIGAWALREACTQGRAWADACSPAKTVTVNISGVELQNDHFLDGLFETLNATGVNPGSLELDITESALMNYPARTASILKALKQRGVRVSVDNFGTGSSNLTSLQRLPLDSLKIDRTLISGVTGNPDETTKVSAMIEMGQNLNLRVIAEGVETSEDLEFLWAHKCDEAVGYYFGQPVPAEQFGDNFRPQEFLIARNSFRNVANEARQLSCSKRWSEPHLGAVEFAQLGIAEEDPVHVLIHLFEPDLFVTEHFADENPALVPTDVSAVVYSPSLKRSGI